MQRLSIYIVYFAISSNVRGTDRKINTEMKLVFQQKNLKKRFAS